MARVLVCADGFFRSFSPIGLEPYIEGFIKALTNIGNEVMPYIAHDFRHSKGWKRKIYSIQSTNEIKAFDPELIITFNNAADPNFLKKVDCPILIVASDTPVYWSNKDFIKKNPNRYSVMFFNDDMSENIKNEFNIPINRQIKIPYSTNIYHPDDKKFDMDISFIGNFYNPSPFLNTNLFKGFNKLSNENKSKLGDLICTFMDELDKNHNKNELTQKTFEQITKIKSVADYDQFISEAFIALTHNKRQKLLNSIADLDLHIYTWTGNFSCISNNYELFRKCHFEPCYTVQDNEKVYNSSKISINLPHAQVNTGFSWRVCDIMGSNALLISNPSVDLTNLFGGIIPTYNNPAELRDRCLYFLKNESERLNIVNECQQIINKNHRFENVFDIIEKYTEIKLSNPNNGKLLNFKRTQSIQNKYKKHLGS